MCGCYLEDIDALVYYFGIWIQKTINHTRCHDTKYVFISDLILKADTTCFCEFYGNASRVAQKKERERE